MASTYAPARTVPGKRGLLLRNSHSCVTFWGQTRRCDESVSTSGRIYLAARLVTRCGTGALPDACEEKRALLLQHLARDHQPLDLVRSFVDLRDLRVPHHPLERILRDVPVTTEDLHCVRRDFHRHVRAVEL